MRGLYSGVLFSDEERFNVFDQMFEKVKPRPASRQLMTMEKKIKEALHTDPKLKVVQKHR